MINNVTLAKNCYVKCSSNDLYLGDILQKRKRSTLIYLL